MSKEELIVKLKELHGSGDTEAVHGIADDLLLKYINDKEIAEAYEKVPKWYA